MFWPPPNKSVYAGRSWEIHDHECDGSLEDFAEAHKEIILDLLKATPRPTESQDASVARKSLFPKLVLRVVASARNSLKSFSTGARLAPSMLRICKALQSGGTDEQPLKVRRRLTRVTSTASAISVASSLFDVDDNTQSTVAHKTTYHSVFASYSTSHRSPSAVSHFAHSAATSDLPPCPRPMRFQKGPPADAEFYEYVDSETLEMVRVHHDNFVLRAEMEEGPSGFGVAKFLDEEVSCGIGGASCNPASVCSALFCLWFAATSCKKLSILFSVLSVCFFQGFFGFVVNLIGDQAAEAPRTKRSGSYWCGNPLVFQEFWNVRRTCLLAVSFLFFLHRHGDVTPSWFRALESHVLRVPDGNGFKKVVFTIFSILTICVGLVFGCFTEAAFLFASLLCRLQRHW